MECFRIRKNKNSNHQNQREGNLNMFNFAFNMFAFLSAILCHQKVRRPEFAGNTCMPPSSLLQMIALLTFNYARNDIKTIVRANLLSLSTAKNDKSNNEDEDDDCSYFFAPLFEPLNVVCLIIAIVTPFLFALTPILNVFNQNYSAPIWQQMTNLMLAVDNDYR